LILKGLFKGVIPNYVRPADKCRKSRERKTTRSVVKAGMILRVQRHQDITIKRPKIDTIEKSETR